MNTDYLSIYHSHLDGLTFDIWVELRQTLHVFKYDVVVFTGIYGGNVDTEKIDTFEIPSYRYFYTRSGESKAGLAVYVNEAVRSIRKTDELFAKCNESVWLELDNSLLVGMCYRLPESERDEEEEQYTIDILQSLRNEKTLNPVVIGNFPPAESYIYGNDADRRLSAIVRERFVQRLTETDICVHVPHNRESLTHGFASKKVCGLGNCLHQPQFFYLNTNPKRSSLMNFYPDYEKGDYDKIAAQLSSKNWRVEFRNLNVTESLEKLMEYMSQVINEYVPQKEEKPDTRVLWQTSRIDRLMKEKTYAWKGVTQEGPTRYMEFARKLEQTYKTEKKKYEEQLVKKYDADPDIIHEYYPNKKKIDRIDFLYGQDGRKLTQDADKAEAFAQHFESVYQDESECDLPRFEVEHKIDAMEVREADVIEELNKIELKKSIGPDKVSSHVLKKLPTILAPPLSIIFARSMNNTEVPESWKIARVVPKFKGGEPEDRLDPKNYRPISITSNICKVMEKLVVNHITRHMRNNKLMSPYQHGYLENRSVTTNMLDATDVWTKALDDGDPVDLVYLDMAKAFDTVPHKRLLYELLRYGINGNINSWIARFLIQRHQFVRIGQGKSSDKLVKSGVPQGSALANLLFIIFVNRIPTFVKNKISMYCDDIKIYAVMEKDESGNYRSTLQADLDALAEWAEESQMSFNHKKCKVMHMGENNPGLSYYMRSKEGERQLIETVEVQRDLGVHVDNKLTFYDHVSRIVAKAMDIFVYMQKRFSHVNEETFVFYYDQYIRCHMEYSSCVWSPADPRDKDRLEHVQYRATEIVHDLENKSYEERLRALKLPTLKHRRMRADLIQIYRFTEEKELLMNLPYIRNRRLHGKALSTADNSSPVRANFLLERAVPRWNQLTDVTVYSDSADTFAERLDEEFTDDEKYRYDFQPGFLSS